MANTIQVKFKDGSIRLFSAGVTCKDLAFTISKSLGKKAVAVKVNGQSFDLSYVLESDAEVEILTLEDSMGIEVMRLTTAHVMAQAIKRLYPEVKLAIGPVIPGGFYYDFADRTFNLEDLSKIEAEMKRIIQENLPIERRVVSREEALAYFQEKDERFKVEMIQDTPIGEEITLYQQGEYTDLCRGPHLPSTGLVKAFKLMSIAGSYWRGDANREMLTRIYGVAFRTHQELNNHLREIEEAKQRDHRKVGKEQEIFMLCKEVGQGLPIWLPKGAKIRRLIESYMIDLEEKMGYEHVYSPHLANINLYKIADYLQQYSDELYPSLKLDKQEELILRPINCPHHMMVFKSKVRSYRDLPVRIAELGMMHRNEIPETLTGLERVRVMTMNDAHIFCRQDQIKEEFKQVVRLIKQVYDDFGIINYFYRLSYPNLHGQDDTKWELSQQQLKETLDELGLDYVEEINDAAPYGGPKLDVQVKTASGKTETLSTIQLDFQLPEHFELNYINETSQKECPMVIHHSILGTLERFIAFLIEQYQGAFPIWLAPIQVRVVTVGQDYEDYAQEVAKKLQHSGIRVELDANAETLNYKIRRAQIDRIPYTLVIGERELGMQVVRPRHYGRGDLGVMSLDIFLARVQEEVYHKELLI
ncbi:threonine--tRNA ligase [Thermoflavimicrobium daqui]|uniref:Threonine--tRNA ligase n=1 Tax=Thermoflavimicrobium daqui TaxID=2137476 RepID=A0A364K3W8_9BACL|nr:threonine--tRNA ligase [Thermoflavimicrobium daqui]RAL24063.1 threonine--tRNA ligase [Thermoflavimicrobium daqui]